MAGEKNRLARLADKKVHACMAYLEVTRQLLATLTAGDMAAVEHHIRRREEMIPVMDRLDRQAGHYGSGNLRGPAGEILTILREIDKVDKACGTVVKNRYNHLKKAMTAVKGYGQTKKSAPQLLSIQM